MRQILFAFILTLTTFNVSSQLKLPDFTYRSSEIDRLEKEAESGNAFAMYNLGHYYQHGIQVSQNLTIARQWYLKAAETENAEVRYKIGRLYEVGQVLDQSIEIAIQHYTFAADNNQSQAKANLGLLYLQKKVADGKQSKGIELLKSAADAGVIEAQVNLFKAYSTGYVVEKNSELAFKYILSAAEAGNDFAQVQVADYYYSKKSFLEAIHWYDLAIEQNSTSAMLKLARMYDLGQGIEANKQKVLLLVEKAAELGNEQATRLLTIYKQQK